MTTNEKHTVYFALTEAGNYLAASVSEPKFLLTGTTIDDVRAKSERALRFFARYNKPIVSKTREHSEVRFVPILKEQLSASECLASA